MGIYLYILVLFGLACLGWMVLLGIGIYRKRRQLRGGMVCIILGSIWAVPGLGMAGLFGFGMYMAFSYEPPEVLAFDPAAYTGETGRITVDYEGSVMLEASAPNKDVRYRLTGDVGGIQAPVGDLLPYNLELRSAGEGGTWTASSRLGRNNKPLRVTAGDPVSLETGLPMTASVTVKQKASRQVALDFKLQGKNGENYSIRGPKRSQIPRFELRNQRGDIVLSGAFSYG